MTNAHLEYCRDLARKEQFDLYAASIFFSQSELRALFWILTALSIETRQIKEKCILNPSLGLSRLEFWKDAIQSLSAKRELAPAHPVLSALQGFCEWHERKHQKELSLLWIKKMIRSTEDYLKTSQFLTMADMEMYGEACSSPIFYTLLEYLAKHLPETHDARTALETMKLTLFDLDHTASHLGKALGLLHFIKHAHHHAARNQCYLPAEILSKYHLSQESMMRPSSQQQEMVASVMHDVASVAAAHLEKVKNELLDKLTLVPRPVLKNNPFALVFLPYIPSIQYLNRLQKSHFHPHHQATHPFAWQLRLLFQLKKSIWTSTWPILKVL